MRIRSLVSIALLAALLGSTPIVVPVADAATSSPIGRVRVATPSAPKWFQKLIDYAGCVTAIIMVKDSGTAVGAAATCGYVAKTWLDD